MLRAATFTILLAASSLGCPEPRARDQASATPVALAVPTDTPAKHTAPPDSGVDLFGYYYLAGDVPVWCADIDQLNLFTIDVDSSASDSTKPRLKTVPLWGFIRLKADSGARPIDFRLKDMNRHEYAFSFGTELVDSVGYDFSGRFLKLGNFPWNPPNGEIVLVGHFRKLRAGRVLAEADVKFSYFAGD